MGTLIWKGHAGMQYAHTAAFETGEEMFMWDSSGLGYQGVVCRNLRDGRLMVMAKSKIESDEFVPYVAPNKRDQWR